MRFLIAHSHPILLVGLKAFLQSNFENLEVDECLNGEKSWLERIASSSYDLVIIDTEFDGVSTIDMIRQARTQMANGKFLVFASNIENSLAKKYFDAGVEGYIKESDELPEIRNAVIDVLKGKKYISLEIRNSLCEKFLSEEKKSPIDYLSPKELEIAKRLAAGKRISEIAVLLHLGNSTVGTHKSRIYRKLNVENAIQLRELFSANRLLAG